MAALRIDPIVRPIGVEPPFCARIQWAGLCQLNFRARSLALETIEATIRRLQAVGAELQRIVATGCKGSGCSAYERLPMRRRGHRLRPVPLPSQYAPKAGRQIRL